MSGSLYLREFSRAVKRANARTPDMLEQLDSANVRKQTTIFGIRRAMRKLGVTANPVGVDLEQLNERELEQVRLEIASQLRRRQREQALPPASSTEHNK